MIHQHAPRSSRSPRIDLGTPGTLRRSADAPADLTIDDLSASGFRIVTTLPLAIGEIFTIGIPGIRQHRAEVVRVTDTGFGCRFLAPIGATVAQAKRDAEPIARPDFGPVANGAIDQPPPEWKLPRPIRLLVILGVALTCWALLIAGYLLLT